jgi:hypothetical protein
MNPLELFQTWAPEGAPWSPWAKPVLFAATSPVSAGASQNWQAARTRARALWTPAGSRATAAMSETALVLDLPGPVALALALDCSAQGWRPVPLFNSCPGPEALVDNESIRVGLAEGAYLLREANLPAAAPPAFVLDCHRTEGQPAPKRFDNRWVVFPQDFPSAARLVASGIRRACLVQHGRTEARSDLAHVLLRWQQAGLEVLALDLASETPPALLSVRPPSRFRAFGYRALVALGLRRNSAGGFGALVPTPGQGAGGGMWA